MVKKIVIIVAVLVVTYCFSKVYAKNNELARQLGADWRQFFDKKGNVVERYTSNKGSLKVRELYMLNKKAKKYEKLAKNIIKSEE